jgi:hypothetical protein
MQLKSIYDAANFKY